MIDAIHVSSPEELYLALAHAQAGQHILLAPGEYDKIALWYGLGVSLDFKGGLTIASADPANPAVIHAFEGKGVQNLTIENVVFDYDAMPGQAPLKRPFKFNDCANVSLSGITFDGDIAKGVGPEADGFATGVGLSVRGCEGVTLSDSKLHGFLIGANFGNSRDVTIENNVLSGMRIDGLTFARMQNLKIEGNWIHSFARNLQINDHSDMIQLWTYDSQSPMQGIEIRNNLFEIGSGDPTQGIFIGNEALDQGHGAEMFYQSVTISGNTMISAHMNGIVVGGTHDLTLSDNTLLEAPRSVSFARKKAPLIRIDPRSTEVAVTDNTVTDIWGAKGQSDWTLSGNIPPGRKHIRANATRSASLQEDLTVPSLEGMEFTPPADPL